MPKFRYEGKSPTRIGTAYVEYGMEVVLDNAPNRLFVEVVPIVAPVVRPKPVKVVKQEEGK